jgi:hypothetical protein
LNYEREIQIRTGKKDVLGATPPSRHRADQRPPAVPTAPSSHSPSPAWGRSDATLDKTLSHGFHASRGRGPANPRVIGPISCPQVPIPEGERRR